MKQVFIIKILVECETNSHIEFLILIYSISLLKLKIRFKSDSMNDSIYYLYKQTDI